MTDIQKYNEEINRQLGDPATMRALLATTFKGLDEVNMKKALLEGLIRGFQFQDFLEKNVYAIPYGQAYSLVTSRDYARKLAQRSGDLISISDAKFVDDEAGKPVSATVVVKKKVLDEIGEFTGTAYFSEYTTGKNLWASKPRTMLEKVSEMMALRKAYPEQLDKAYIEEEMATGNVMEMIDGETLKEIAALTLETLPAYYQANKGKGKAFDQAIIARKRELEATKDVRDENAEPKD